MNRKAQSINVGMLIIIAIAVIVGLTLLTGGITDGVGKVTNTGVIVNSSYVSAAAGSSINLPFQAVRSVTIQNASSGEVIPATNYTVTNYVVSNGQLVTQLTSKAGAGGWQGKAVNISGTVEPFGYDTNAGGRVMANLIIVFSALALFIVVLVPIIKNLDFF